MSIKTPEKVNSKLAEKYDSNVVEQSLATRKRLTYNETKKVLSRLADNTQDEETAWVYAILADVCGMSFTVRNTHVGYVPFCEIDGNISFKLENVEPSLCELLAAIVPKVKDNLLRARIADVVSMRRKGLSGVEFVQYALDAYFSIDLYDALTWRMDGFKRWKRAIDLARSERGGEKGAECVRRITEVCFEEIAINRKIEPEKFLAISNLIVDCSLYTEESSKNVEQALRLAYDNFGEPSACLGRNDCCDLLIKMYQYLKKRDKISYAWSLKGDGLKKEGLRLLAEGKDKVMAAFRFEEAEKAYMAIPKKDRENFKIDEKIKHCHQLKREGFAYWSRNLRRIEEVKIDIKDVVEVVKRWMDVEDACEAFNKFLHVYRFDPKDWRGFAGAFKEHTFLLSFFPTFQIDSNGRIESKGGLAESFSAAHWISLIVHQYLLPAYQILKKFLISRYEFECIARQNISLKALKGRCDTMAGAWWLGFSGDFRLAATILVPQIEYAVSQVLEKKGVKVTYIQQDSMVETYMSISSILALPEAKEYLGEALCNELELLFGAAPNLNLRNKMMHGLVDDPNKGGVYDMDLYIWWLSMRMFLIDDVFCD